VREIRRFRVGYFMDRVGFQENGAQMAFLRLVSCFRFHHYLWVMLAVVLSSAGASMAQNSSPKFKVVALAEAGGIHRPFVDAAKVWLQKQSEEGAFSVDYIENTDKINDEFLSHYQLFIQLNYPPYGWTPTAVAAFTKYIEEGRGGWIGFHHATLLGEFDGYGMWPWFSQFMGGIRYTDYIPQFATATVVVEDPSHPLMKNVAGSFVVDQEEWYTYDKSPRPNVHVLAHVNEATYSPDTKKKMGDHPVIWTNERYKARNVYIFMGHHPELFHNPAFTVIFRNAIFWAAGQ
jgi:type 1 glutamine amidotransferase